MRTNLLCVILTSDAAFFKCISTVAVRKVQFIAASIVQVQLLAS
jgi:hypothetical protein